MRGNLGGKGVGRDSLVSYRLTRTRGHNVKRVGIIMATLILCILVYR